MIMRRRPLLRAAAVGGTAYAAGRSTGRRAEEREQAEYYQNQRLSDLEQRPQAPPVPSQQAAGAPATSPMLDQLNQLATLHQQGALTDAEFAAAKAKLLGT